MSTYENLLIHPHEFIKIPSNETTFTCGGCMMRGSGERYRCNKTCHFDLHESCMHPPAAPPQAITSLLSDKKMTFRFLDMPAPARLKSCGLGTECVATPGRVCDICAKTVQGFGYHCEETDLDVHPLCAKLEREISIKDAKFELRKGTPTSNCNRCHTKKLKDSEKKVPGCYYYSNAFGKPVCFHVYCLSEMVLKLGSSEVGVQTCATTSNSIISRGTGNEKKLQKKPIKGPGMATKFGKQVGLFLKAVLSVLFGDPTMVIDTYRFVQEICQHLAS